MKPVNSLTSLPTLINQYKNPFLESVHDATSILQNAFNMTARQAETFINQYNVDRVQLEDSFFLIREEEINNFMDPIQVIDRDYVHTGNRIGSGFYGIVYAHPENNHLVLKKLKRVGYMPSNSGGSDSMQTSSSGSIPISSGSENYLSQDNKLEAAKKEVNAFRRYYGSESARIILTSGEVYIEMQKLPGQRICDIRSGGFQHDAIDRFWDMIFRLDRHSIWHNDLSLTNILYDYESNTFYPIDIDTFTHDFSDFELSVNSQDRITSASVDSIKRIIEHIQKNLV